MSADAAASAARFAQLLGMTQDAAREAVMTLVTIADAAAVCREPGPARDEDLAARLDAHIDRYAAGAGLPPELPALARASRPGTGQT